MGGRGDKIIQGTILPLRSMWLDPPEMRTLLMAEFPERHIKAFELRFQEKLKLREIGEKIGRLDGTGPICKERARQMIAKTGRWLLHPRQRDHRLRKIAEEIRA